MRLPVAAKIALQSAGVNGGTPGSPTPLAGTSMPFSTMWVFVTVGDLLVPDNRVVVEVALLDTPVLKRDLAVFGEREPHHGCAFDLRSDALRIDVKAAVDRGVDARHREVALVVDGDLDHGGNIADEAAMRRDTEPVTGRQLPSPAGFLGRKLGDPPQPSGVDRIDVVRVTIVPPRRSRLLGRFHEACRTDQFQQEILGIAAELVRNLGDEGLDRPGMR